MELILIIAIIIVLIRAVTYPLFGYRFIRRMVVFVLSNIFFLAFLIVCLLFALIL